MTGLFPVIIVILFCFAALVHGVCLEWTKFWFYLFSALINLTVLLMR